MHFTLTTELGFGLDRGESYNHLKSCGIALSQFHLVKGVEEGQVGIWRMVC